MNIALVTLVCYMVFIVGLSVFSTKLLKNKDSISYLVAGKSMPWALVAVMTTGIAVGGASTLGVAASAYQHGLSASWYTLAWACSALCFGLVMSNKVRKLGIITVPGLIHDVFGKIDAKIAIAVQVVLMFGITALQIVAGGAVLTSLLPDVFTNTSGMIVSTAVFILTSFIGGYLGASVANLLNVIVIYLGLIVALIALIPKFGGLDTITMALPANGQWFDFFAGIGPAVVVGWVITMVIQSPPNQGMFQAAAAARDAKNARMGFLVATLLMAPTGILAAMIGIIAVSQFPGLTNANLALPMMVTSLNPVIAGLILSGLWAADVSTAIGQMLGVSTIVTKDIVKEYIKPDISEKGQVIVSKIVLVSVALLGLLTAMHVKSILGFLMQLLTLFTPYSLVVLAILYVPGLVRKSSCLVTVLAGLAIMIIWVLIPASHVVSQVIYLALPICAAALLFVSLVDSRPANVGFITEALAKGVEAPEASLKSV